MKLFLLAGTTEGREIAGSGLPLVCSVATEYGAELLSDLADRVDTRVGRMDAEEMERFIAENEIAGVIDATHPHAVEVTKNARRACEHAFVPYVRVVRESVKVDPEEVAVVSSCSEAAKLLDRPPWSGGSAFLAVGSKELARFAEVEGYKKRLFARVLPVGEVICACEKMGFDAGHVIAMQGPFSKEINKAMLEATRARVLVTKDSGVSGGLREKLEAARECGVGVILVRRPEETGMTAAEAVDWGFGLLRGAHPQEYPFFPFFVDIRDRRAYVVGGGEVALRRTRTLLACGARVIVVSPAFDKGFEELVSENKCRLELAERNCRWEDIERNAFMVVLATDDRRINRELGTKAREAGAHVSVADAPDECTFFFPALVAEGGVAAAVSTGGKSPASCKRLAERLRAVWPEWVAEEKMKDGDE